MTDHAAKMAEIERDDWYIELADGSKWFPAGGNTKPSPEVLAHALGNLGRYTGHSTVFYSVAEHLVKASYLVPEHLAYEALMHDAHEAIVNDLSKPVKMYIGGSYDELEDRTEVEIRRMYGLTDHIHPLVKHADILMALIEADTIMPSRGENWTYYGGYRDEAMIIASERPELRPEGWSPNITGYNAGRASTEWLRRYRELTNGQNVQAKD